MLEQPREIARNPCMLYEIPMQINYFDNHKL